MVDNEVLQRGLEEAGLGPIVPPIMTTTLEGLCINTSPADDADLSIGASKLGGLPDLPPSIAWPRWGDNSLSFLAQINLADIVAKMNNTDLPQSGLLSFFYVPDQSAWGFDPAQKDAWRVFLHEDISNLTRCRLAPDLADRDANSEQGGFFFPHRL